MQATASILHRNGQENDRSETDQTVSDQGEVGNWEPGRNGLGDIRGDTEKSHSTEH